jgi:tetratricopeptide (TPR) repeat protein
MIAAGLAPPLARVVGAGFTAVAGARAYTMAGSFAHFLLSAYGPEKFRAIYRSGGDFPGVYGRPLAALEGDWRRFLETQPLDEQERARARERFRRPAIFAKVCARDLAARVGEARERLYSLPDEAVALLRSVCADDPGEPSHRLDLAEALFAAGSAREALAEAQQVISLPDLTRPLEARAASLAASIHYHAGHFDDAARATRRALEAATEDGEQRTAMARLRALEDEHARATLGRVLFGESPTRGVDPALVVFLIERFSQQFPAEALGPYLMARQLTARDPRLATISLERACPLAGGPPLAQPLPQLFAEECRRMTAENAFRAGDLGRSRRAWEEIHTSARTQADRLRAGDFLERIAWEERRLQARPADAGGPDRHILPP